MATYLILGIDQKQYGPATLEQVRAWLAEGRLNSSSQIKRDDSPGWQPLGSYPELAGAVPPLMNPPPPRTDAALGAQYQATEARVESMLLGPARLDVGDCLARGWHLVMDNAGLFFSAAFVVWIIGTVSQYIPMLGLVYLVFHGVFYGGLYLIILKRIRGEPANVGMTFDGFRIALVQLLLAGLIGSLLSWIGIICCLVIPGLYLLVSWIFSLALVMDKRLEFWQAMETSRKRVGAVWFQVFGLMLLAFLPFLLSYFVITGVSISLIIPKVQQMLQHLREGGMDPRHMMQFGFTVGWKSMLLGLITRGVLLLNLPFALSALMYAYEGLFSKERRP
jgi:hypothetical protein